MRNLFTIIFWFLIVFSASRVAAASFGLPFESYESYYTMILATVYTIIGMLYGFIHGYISRR